MKLITFFPLLFTVTASCQHFEIRQFPILKDSMEISHFYPIVIRDSSGKRSSIEILKDGSYIIDGDTVALIKALVDENKRIIELSNLKTETIQAASQWSNDVSDYFKIDNGKFTDYLKLLHKLGYTGWIKTIRYTKPKIETVL